MSSKTKSKKARPAGDYFRFSAKVKRTINQVKKRTGWSKKTVVENAVISAYPSVG